MKGEPVPDQDHILRYVAPRHIDDGVISGSGFLGKPGENAPSVSWLECYPEPLENQLSEVRRRSRLKYGAAARLVRLNVGQTRAYVAGNSPFGISISVLHDPQPADAEHPLEDPAHSLMHGIPDRDSPQGETVGDLIVNCILEQFPARG